MDVRQELCSCAGRAQFTNGAPIHPANFALWVVVWFGLEANRYGNSVSCGSLKRREYVARAQQVSAEIDGLRPFHRRKNAALAAKRDHTLLSRNAAGLASSEGVLRQAQDDTGREGGGVDKAAYVREMFAQIAPRYDVANRAISAGMDEFWRKRAIAVLSAPRGARSSTFAAAPAISFSICFVRTQACESSA